MKLGRILVFGATSAIATETARALIGRPPGARFYLVGRSPEKLEAVAQDLRVRGAGHVDTREADLNRTEEHTRLYDAACKSLGGSPDLVLVAHGTLGDQKASERDFRMAEREYETNFLSVVSLLTPVATDFEEKKAGRIAVISSVAGDRGRQSNYIYGSAKAGLTAFLSGLRNRLAPAGVQVLTVKPGFVDTPMTGSFRKGPLWASPARVAAGIVRSLERDRNVVYLPWFWWGIMLVIRMIPERIFKNLKL